MGHIYQGRLRWGGRIKGVTQDSWSTASVTAINLDKMVVIQNDPAILAQVEQVHFSLILCSVDELKIVIRNPISLTICGPGQLEHGWFAKQLILLLQPISEKETAQQEGSLFVQFTNSVPRSWGSGRG